MPKVYQALASTLQAWKGCKAKGESHAEWADKHQDRIDALMEKAPSGSGFDSGTKLDVEKSGPDKLVFNTSYHHMNDNGFYDGWTEHSIIITPSFHGFHVRITGRDRNDIKDRIGNEFDYWLSKEEKA